MSEKAGISRRTFGLGALGLLGLAAAGGAVDFFEQKYRESLGPTANKVTFREDGILQVNQKEVFPFGLYYLPGQENSETWQKMGTSGFNLITQDGQINSQSLTFAEQNNVYTMAYVPYAFPNIDKTGIDPKIVQQLRSSKSFLGYYSDDEPNLNLDKNMHVQLLKRLAELDPDHPQMPVFYETSGFQRNISYQLQKKNYSGSQQDLNGLPNNLTIDGFAEWFVKNSGAHIVGFDDYDHTDVVGVSEITREYAQNLRQKKFGNQPKALWVTLSAHSEIPWTSQQMRYQAVSVIANGATGVLWWDWPSGCNSINCKGYQDGNPNGYSTHWSKLQSILADFNLVKDGLIGREVSLGQTEGGAVSYKITQGNDKFFVFSAYNFYPDSGEISQNIPGLPKNTKFNVVGENREVNVGEDGILRDNFNYLDAHIYTQV